MQRLPNMTGPTLGGWQWWTDRRITASGWRVQRHVITGHHRLLDSRNWRRATGSLRACLRGLRKAPASDPRPTVVLLHGLSRTRRAMNVLANQLRSNGFHVLNFSYASTRADVDLHVRALADVLEAVLPGTPVHFVGHSLGNLVVRRYFRMYADRLPRLEWGRAVMLAPPNSGSVLAKWLHETPIVRPFLTAILGRSGLSIATWSDLSAALATTEQMPVRVGVIAADFRVRNPIVGQGDLVVSVEETRLAGADHLVVIGNHTLLMRDRVVVEATLRFLQTGHFAGTPSSLLCPSHEQAQSVA